MGTVDGQSREEALRRLAGSVASGLGVEVVEVVYREAGSRSVLRVDIDRPGLPGVGVDDCERMSRVLGEVLDQEDLFPGRYTLEVSSPGIDRPIRTADDMRRNSGRAVIAHVEAPSGGHRTVRGVLLGLSESLDTLRLRDAEGDEIRLDLKTVRMLRQDPKS